MKNVRFTEKRHLYRLSFLAVLLFICLAPVEARAGILSQPPNNLGLIGYWPFNEGTGTTAGDFAGSNDANFAGDPQWEPGKFGTAVALDGTGSEYIAIGQAIDWSAQSYTVSVWFRLDALTALGDSPNLFRILYGSASHDFLDLDISGANFELKGEVNTNNERWNLGDTGVAKDLDWHLLTIVFSPGSVAGYIDGAHFNTIDTSGINQSIDINRLGAGNHDLGCCSSSYGDYWLGRFDDFRIYNRTLSAGEITGLYRSGFAQINQSRALENISGLIGWWTFDGADINDAEGIVDRSGSGNHGQFVNGATSSATTVGRVGQALSFDGSGDFVDVGAVGDFDSDFTVSLWVKTDTHEDTAGLFTRTDPGHYWNDKGFSITTISSPDRVYVKANDGTNNTTRQIITDSDTYGWTHLTVVREGDTLITYRDGNHLADDSLSGIGAITGSQNLFLGKGNNRDWIGEMDDVRMYDRALSADEIERIYNATRPSTVNVTRSTGSLSDSLVGHWSFDGPDIDRATISDTSGGGNDGNTENGIHKSYASGNLTITPNQWGGASNPGEFDITCPDGDESCQLKTTGGILPIQDINNGAGCQDGATYSGYIMYSEESVHTRFSGAPPNPNNADNFICVRYNSGWEYDRNTTLVSFTPEPSDVLIAEIDTSADTVTLLDYAPIAAIGRIGQGLSFNGSEHVELGDILDMGTDSYSASAWIKTTNTSGTSQYMLTKADTSATDGRWAFGMNAGTIRCNFDPNSAGSVVVNGNASVADGQWHHVMCIWDRSGTLSVYVNGVFDASMNIEGEGDNLQTSFPLRIGAYTNNSGGDPPTLHFDGTIDDIRLYNKVLSENEIQRLYNMGR